MEALMDFGGGTGFFVGLHGGIEIFDRYANVMQFPGALHRHFSHFAFPLSIGSS